MASFVIGFLLGIFFLCVCTLVYSWLESVQRGERRCPVCGRDAL